MKCYGVFSGLSSNRIIAGEERWYGVFIEIVVTSISCILHQPGQYGLVCLSCKGKLAGLVNNVGIHP